RLVGPCPVARSAAHACAHPRCRVPHPLASLAPVDEEGAVSRRQTTTPTQRIARKRAMTTALRLNPAVPPNRASLAICRLLTHLRGGQLEMRWPDGSSSWHGEGPHKVRMQVHDVGV